FTSVRHHNASTASFRPALTEAPAAQPAALGTARSIPGHALAFDVEFPLSGSRSGLTPPISTSVPGTPQLAYGSPVFAAGGIPVSHRCRSLPDNPYATGEADAADAL